MAGEAQAMMPIERTRRVAKDVVIKMVIDSVESPNTKRFYKMVLRKFLKWCEEADWPALSKALIQDYRNHLLTEQGLARSTVNAYLAAVRKLVNEAADNGLVSPRVAMSVKRVKGLKLQGQTVGKWLTEEEAQELLYAPNPNTLRGLRNRALLAVLLSTGLRRAEASSLCFEHIQQRDKRWVIANLVGKGAKVRTIPIPLWTKLAIDAWQEMAGLDGTGPVFRAILNGGEVNHKGISAQTVYDIVLGYTRVLGFHGVTPHDLRRTFARSVYKKKAPPEQIQYILGHKRLETTLRYIGARLNLEDSPCDRLGLKL